VHLVVIKKKFITIHGNMNVKFGNSCQHCDFFRLVSSNVSPSARGPKIISKSVSGEVIYLMRYVIKCFAI
jgi:hypothetical protein